MSAQPHDQDDVQGAVGVTVAAAVESVTDGLAAGGLQRAHTAELGERGLVGDATGVVADGGQKGGGSVRATP